MKLRSFLGAFASPALYVLMGLTHPALAAVEKETLLGLPVEFSNQTYALKGGVAIELQKLKVQTTSPIEIERAWVKPDWADWITQFRTSRVRVETGEISARPSSLSRLGVVDGPTTHMVTRLQFSGLKLRLGTSPLNLPAGEMRYGANGALTSIRINIDGGLTMELTPRAGGKLGIQLQSAVLKWPVLPAFSFESVVAEGEIGDDYIALNKIGTNGDGGAISGALRLVAAGKFRLEGELKMEGLRAADVINRLYPRSTVDGQLSGTFKLNASGESIEALAKSVAISGTYTLKSGTIDRFGLLEGMRRSGKGVAGGGLVRFETLSGKFSGRTGAPAQADFQGLSSGALRGSCAFTVQQDGRLQGLVNGSLTLPGGENVARTFDLSGKVDAPILSLR